MPHRLRKAPERPPPVAARRKRRSAAELRKRLLDAAREEFVAHGFSGATTAAISRRAQVAEIQMFRYFPSKLALFEEAISAPLKAHFERFNRDHLASADDAAAMAGHAQRYIAELQDFLERHADGLVSLFVAQKAGPAAGPGSLQDSGFRQFLNAAAQSLAARSTQTQDGSPETVTRIAFGALLGCITYRDWLFPDGSGAAEGVSQAIGQFILAGVARFADLGLGGPLPQGTSDGLPNHKSCAP